MDLWTQQRKDTGTNRVSSTDVSALSSGAQVARGKPLHDKELSFVLCGDLDGWLRSGGGLKTEG